MLYTPCPTAPNNLCCPFYAVVFYVVFTRRGTAFTDFLMGWRRYYAGEREEGEAMLDAEMIALVLLVMSFMLALLHYLTRL